MQTKLQDLVKAVNVELKKAERAYKVSKKSAEEVAATSRTSWSQAGDRFHSQGTADLAKQRLETMKLLKDEIEAKGEKVCIEHDGEVLYLVDNPIFISGFKLVSTKSPLGAKLSNI